MTKAILFPFILACMLTSCASFSSMTIDNNIKKISIGMTPEQVVSFLGKGYEVVSASEEATTFAYQSYNGVYNLIFVNGRLKEWYKEWLPNSSSYQPGGLYYPGTSYQPGGTYPGHDIEYFPEFIDNKGRRTTISKDVFGNTVIQDDRGNKVTIKKDIFGNLQIEDNNGNRTSYEKDIFGNLIYNHNGRKISIEKDIFDNLQYKDSRGKNASLKKDIFDVYTYTDSNGNKISFDKETWRQTSRRFDSDQAFFVYLIRRYLY